MNVLSDKKDWKNAGQLDTVKLLPKLESNALGNAKASEVEDAVAVCVAEIAAVVASPAAARLVKRTRGSGGGLLSKRISLCPAAMFSKLMAAARHELHHDSRQSDTERMVRRLTTCNDVQDRRRGCSLV